MNSIEHEPVPTKALNVKEAGVKPPVEGAGGQSPRKKKNVKTIFYLTNLTFFHQQFFFLKVKKISMGKILIIIQTTNTKYSNYFFLFYQFFDISSNYSLRYGLGR